MLDERDKLTDSLVLQKYKSNTYNVAATESANRQLMDVFMGILRDEHQIGHEIFLEMNNRGWYQPKAANMNEFNQNIQKWGQELNHLQQNVFRQAGHQPATNQPGYHQYGQQQTPIYQHYGNLPHQQMQRPPQNPVI